MTAADRFERIFVFRLARVLPLLAAALGVLGLLVGAAIGVYSLLPARRPAQEAPAPPPGAVQVNASDVAARLRATATSVPSAPVPPVAPELGVARARTEPSRPTVPSESATRIAAGVDTIRALLEAARAPWENVYTTECAYAAPGGRCLRTEQRLSGQGLRRRLFQTLGRYDTDATAERVEIADSSTRKSSRTYVINPSNSQEKLAVLAELARIMTVAADSDRSAAFRAWSDIRAERERARREAIDAEASRVAQVNAEREAARVAVVARRGVAKITAVRLVGAALSSTLLVGLMLALLAVERNTRELHRVLSQLESSRNTPSTGGTE